jgi:hypothetical protein
MASRYAIHGNIDSSVRVSHFIGVPSLGDVRSLGHSTNLGAKAIGGLTSDRISSRSRLCISKVYPHSAMYAVFQTAPASVLKLPVD